MGGALRDDTNNSCVTDESTPQLLQIQEISQERTDVWPKRTFVQLLISDQGFNANRFCYIGNWEGRELAGVRGEGGGGQ